MTSSSKLMAEMLAISIQFSQRATPVFPLFILRLPHDFAAYFPYSGTPYKLSVLRAGETLNTTIYKHVEAAGEANADAEAKAAANKARAAAAARAVAEARASAEAKAAAEEKAAAEAKTKAPLTVELLQRLHMYEHIPSFM
jgi:hypothetical protein